MCINCALLHSQPKPPPLHSQATTPPSSSTHTQHTHTRSIHDALREALNAGDIKAVGLLILARDDAIGTHGKPAAKQVRACVCV